MSYVFLSHSTKDKPTVRRIAERLTQDGIGVWVDEAEIRLGESLIEKISAAISETDFVAAIISKHSVKSAWVQKELSLAMTKEINGRRVVVLPILIEKCDLPFFLSDKLYADLTSPEGFDAGCEKIVCAVRSIGRPSPNEMAKKTRKIYSPAFTDTEWAVGISPTGRDRPEDAFTALRDTKAMREVATVYIGGGLALMALVFIIFFFTSLPLHVTLLLLLTTGFLAMSGTVFKLAATYLLRAFHNDANLMIAYENIKGFYVPFGPTWRKQYRMGQHNAVYLIGLWIATAAYGLQFVSIMFLILAMVMFLSFLG